MLMDIAGWVQLTYFACLDRAWEKIIYLGCACMDLYDNLDLKFMNSSLLNIGPSSEVNKLLCSM